MLVTVEYIRRDNRGFLPGSRRELIKGAAIDLERRGMAKIVIEPKTTPRKRKTKAKDVNTVDTDPDNRSD